MYLSTQLLISLNLKLDIIIKIRIPYLIMKHQELQSLQT